VAHMLTQEPIYKPSSIFYFKPILLSAHKLTLLIYGDNSRLHRARVCSPSGSGGGARVSEMAVAPFRRIIRSPAVGATGLLLQEGYAGHAVGVDGAGSASWPSCRLAFCCGRGSSFRLSCVACLFRVLGAAGDRGFAFRSMVCRPSGRIVFFLFLLPVWLLGGLLCVAISANWSAEARGRAIMGMLMAVFTS